jgi:hypothetical protein
VPTWYEDFRKDLTRADVPTLVVQGDADRQADQGRPLIGSKGWAALHHLDRDFAPVRRTCGKRLMPRGGCGLALQMLEAVTSGAVPTGPLGVLLFMPLIASTEGGRRQESEVVTDAT